MQSRSTNFLRLLLPALMLAGCDWYPLEPEPEPIPDPMPLPEPDPATCEQVFGECVQAANGDPMLLHVC